ncbi:MAG TPA: NADH-quinone oxidoreductase subunit NuoH [Herpetosiphonaceae bacterium]
MQALWNAIFGEGWLANLATYITISTAILIVGPVMMMLFTWIERRGIAYMQDRKGPNRVGPFGLFQPIAEAIKTMTKEDITPAGADRWVHFLAPVVVMFATIMTFAVIPWGNLVPVDINIGVLFIVAIGAMHTLGMLMAGWGSNNKFALLGGMRAAAQMISYEIPQVMSLVSIVMLVGTMSVRTIVENQRDWFGFGWYVFTPIGLLAFIIFWISSLAEGERTPFDIPEADSEIVAGYMTEYSGMKFAVFYLAQYMTNLAICAVAAAVFLGGGAGPGSSIQGGLGTFLSVIYFLIKTIGLFFLMVWIRGTFPRLRIDQLMAFAWKFLLPLALINIFSTSLWIAITRWGVEQGMGVVDGMDYPVRLAIAFAVTGVINVVSFLLLVRMNTSRGAMSYQTSPSGV